MKDIYKINKEKCVIIFFFYNILINFFYRMEDVEQVWDGLMNILYMMLIRKDFKYND